jgi:hypothetical protein
MFPIGAVFNMGEHYRTGEEVPMDSLKAMDYFERAANMGMYQAACNMAAMYLQGPPPIASDLLKARDVLVKYQRLHPEVTQMMVEIDQEISHRRVNGLPLSGGVEERG